MLNDLSGLPDASAVPAIPFGRRYILHNQLGAGSMGIVYRATDRLMGQQVALKRVLTPAEDLQFSSTVDRNESRTALIEEFKTLASLRHPSIITVRDYGFDAEGYPYFTMDLLETPKTLLGAGWNHPLAIQINLLTQVLQALAYLHRYGILHRDLKPGNVLVTSTLVKVVDFGLAVPHEKADGTVGTLAYMAPEILSGDPISTATDLWAVGVMAYQLFVGAHPFNTTSNITLLYDILNTEPIFTSLADAFTDDVLTDPTAGQIRHDTPDLTQTAPPPQLLETRPVNESDGPLSAFENAARVGATAESDDTPPTIGGLAGLLRELANNLPDEDTANQPDADLLKTTLLTGLPQKPSTPDDGPHISPLSSFGEGPGVRSENPVQSVATNLTAVLQRLLHKDTAHRYRDAYTVIRDLCEAVNLTVELETSATRESFLQAAPFLARDAEIQQLTAALDNAITGHGTAWLVAGESGVGKSRLINELRTRALVKGVQVVRGQQVNTGGGLFQVWRAVLRWLALLTDLSDLEAGILMPLVPDIATVINRPVETAPELEPAATQQRLLATVASILRRQAEPLLLILEDMHWAGDESLAVLQQAAQLVQYLPVMLVATCRDDERPDLPTRLAEMNLLELHRFAKEDVRRLAVAMVGKAAHQTQVMNVLADETDGNVFFLVEVVRAWAEEAGSLDEITPETLQTSIVTGGMEQIIQRRMEKVPESARPLLKLAAIAGRRIRPALLQAADPTADLDRWLLICAEAAILEIQEEQWQFAHDKLREWLMRNIPANEQPELHRRVALAIEQVYPAAAPAQYAAALANHWHHAADPAKERHYSIIAGKQSLAVSNFHQATTYFTRALELTPLSTNGEGLGVRSTDSPSTSMERGLGGEVSLTPAALHIQLGITQWCLSNFEEARVHLTTASELARPANDTRTIADALRYLSSIELDEGEVETARQHLHESLALLQQQSAPDALAQIYNNLGEAARLDGEIDAARRAYETSLQIATTANDQAALARAVNNLGFLALQLEDWGEARRQFEASLAIDRATGNRKNVGRGLSNLAYVLDELGDYNSAKATLIESLEIAEEVGDRAGASIMLDNLGAVSTNLGHYADAARYLRHAFALATDVGYMAIILDAPVETARLLITQHRNLREAVELLGMVINHPASNNDVARQADDLLDEIRALEDPTLANLDTILATANPDGLDALLNRLLLDLN